MRTLLVLGCLAVTTAFVGPAFATTDAYVLIETDANRGGDVMNTNWGFGQCKGLAHMFRPDEIVVQVACTDLASLQNAVGADIPARDGVKRVTLWIIEADPR
ncbi:MAG: hypothetical protein Q8Q62_09240 [Mesorhizobium sp.]|nr:hypothetical protein [Mesorhizobium sp.]